MKKLKVEYNTKSGKACGIHFFVIPDNTKRVTHEQAKIKLCQDDNFLKKDDLIIRSVKII